MQEKDISMTCGYADMFIILVFQLFPSYFSTMGEPNLHASLKITEIISINSPTFSNYKLLIFKHILGIFKSIYVDILLHTFVHKNSDAFHSKYVFNYLTLESNYIKVIPLICKHENPVLVPYINIEKVNMSVCTLNLGIGSLERGF